MAFCFYSIDHCLHFEINIQINKWQENVFLNAIYNVKSSPGTLNKSFCLIWFSVLQYKIIEIKAGFLKLRRSVNTANLMRAKSNALIFD